MEENFRIVELCDSCNTKCDLWNVRHYEVFYEGSKIHDQNKIILCYVCSQIAKHSQQFINNVKKNVEMKPDVELIKKSIINLSVLNLESIHVSGTDHVESESSYIILSAVNGKLDMDSQSNIKVEDLFIEQDIYDEISCLEDLEYTIIKQELNGESISQQKESIKNVTVNKKLQKKKRIKKKGENILDGNKEENSNKVLTVPTIVYLTPEEYLQEKEQKRKNEPYLRSLYQCADCVLGFGHKFNYLKHMEKHSESAGQFVCELCKQRVSTKQKLKHHLHMHKTRYKCVHCNLLRNQAATIREHLYFVHKIGNAPKAECDKCYMVYNRHSSLRKHIKLKHTPRKKVPCTYCQKLFSTLETLKRHMILKHSEDLSPIKKENNFVCQECGAGFRTQSYLKSHQLKHSNRRDYYCVECDKGFKSETGLRLHLKTTATHVIYSDLPLACTQCEKRFAIKRDLDRHINSVHLNVRPFQCDQCSKAYCSVWSLNEHKKIIHEGYRRPLIHQCEFCDKAFSRRQILKAHTRTHTGERPYQCDKCQASFTQSSILATHNKLVHLRLTRNGKSK